MLPVSPHLCFHPSRALLFPAVDPHHRYLIHSTVQDHFPHLTSVSVGEGDQRRTAVSFRSAPSPPDSPLVGHTQPRDHGYKPPGTPHHDLDRRKECMQTTTQPNKQAQHTQHTTHKQQQQQHPQHKTHQLDKPQNKVQQEVVRAPTDTRRSENQLKKEEKPQQTQHNAPQQQQSRQPPRYRSHSSSSSHSRHRHWRDSVSPHHRTDTHTDTPTQQGKPTPDDTHSKRRRNRKNKRLKDKTEHPQDNANDHVNNDKQTLQNTEPGQVTGRGQVNPNGRVTRRAEWTNSAGVGEGGIRKKCKSVEAAAVSRSNTRGQNNSEECERR